MAAFGDLAGKSAIVTGASSGIGRAIALEFARAGANVIVHYSQSREAAESVAAQIRLLGVRSTALAADFSSVESCHQLITTAFSAWGSLDIFVQNAGVDLLTGDAAQLAYQTKLERLLDVDVRAGMILAKKAGEQMLHAGGGAILMIGWDQADRGMAGDSGELFCAAKNAVMGFSRSLALSLAPKIRVNCIAPGWIKTAWGEMAIETWQQRVLHETPLLRWGQPEDIARLARFLVSDDAAYITGQVINCNGGAVR